MSMVGAVAFSYSELELVIFGKPAAKNMFPKHQDHKVDKWMEIC